MIWKLAKFILAILGCFQIMFIYYLIIGVISLEELFIPVACMIGVLVTVLLGDLIFRDRNN